MTGIVLRYIFFLSLVFLASCKKEELSSNSLELTLVLRHQSMGKKLAEARQVHDSSGHTLAFSRFQYYLSNVSFIGQNSADTYEVPVRYFLIKALNDSGETRIIIPNFPLRSYRAIRMHIGLDSIANSGLNGTGALDPGNGMYWPWSKEYKFMVMEGRFQRDDVGGSFLYHIAGNPCYRKIEIPLTDGKEAPLKFREGSRLILNSEVSALFGAPNRVDFQTFNDVTTLETGAGKIADNYSSGSFMKLAGLE